MRARIPLGTFLLVLFLPSLLLATPNSDARIVLHAYPFGALDNCTTPQTTLGLNCDTVRPTVTVSPGQDVEVYVYLHSYDSVAGAQMAFTWHSSWTFMYWVGPCQGHELLAVSTPQTSGDSYVGAFDPITGGQLQPIGRMRFIAGSAGTQFTITETWAPGGTGTIDSQMQFSTVPSEHRGVIAAGGPGVDSCGGKSESSALFEE